MPIENILAKVKDVAKAALTSDWLSKAKEVAKASAPQRQSQGKFEKLQALKLKQFALTGSKDDPAILIVTALNNIHETSVLKDDGSRKKVFDIEVSLSSDPNTPAGKYSCWMDYFVLEDELNEYAKQFPNGDLTGQSFMICAYGKVKKQSNPKQSVYLFRVLEAPAV